MIRVFISCPIRGKDSIDVINTRNEILNKVKKKLNTDDIYLIDSYFNDFDLPNSTIDKDIYCLGRSIIKMSEANFVVFSDGWEKARGCRVEHEIAVNYNLHILNV